MLKRWKRRRAAKDGRQPAITKCCGCGVEMKEVGDELFIACSGCGGRIGNITIREVALLALRFKDHLAQSKRVRGIDREFSDAELDSMADEYIELLHRWAREAVDQILGRHLNG